MSMNWLEGMNDHADGSGQPHPMAMPVFAGQKLVVVGGSSGMGRQTAADVVAAGGSAVIIGQDPGKIDDTVQTLAKDGPAYGIAADLADRMQVERVCQQLADEHTDATLLVNAAGLFIPKPFLDHDGADYDSYSELDPAARPGRHRPRPGQHHHLPAVPGHRLGHRRHLERRRRRHGWTQLTTRPYAGPGHPAHGPRPGLRPGRTAGHTDPGRTR